MLMAISTYNYFAKVLLTIRFIIENINKLHKYKAIKTRIKEIPTFAHENLR